MLSAVVLRRAGAHLRALSPAALAEAWYQRRGHPVELPHRPHLTAAVRWLVRAQDATGTGGIARGFSLRWHPEFGGDGWQPAYPEATGYIVPTLFELGRRLQQPDLTDRALRAAHWTRRFQLSNGAMPGGVADAPIVAPAVFNTGQVMFGWLAAFRQTGDGRFADALRRASRFLTWAQDADGLWRRGNSRYADPRATLYNTRVAWAVAETGMALSDPVLVQVARRNLDAVAARQHANGWIPDCCLNDPARPLLHTTAYAIRGLLEGARILDDDALRARAALAAAAVAERVQDDGWLPGRFDASWTPAVSWCCLTGSAQMANIWLQLAARSDRRVWREPASRVIRYLKRTQNRMTRRRGLRGGILGADPMGAPYGAHEVLSWATKFFIDLLLRDDDLQSGTGTDPDGPHRYA